jgi:hypothetical protein
VRSAKGDVQIKVSNKALVLDVKQQYLTQANVTDKQVSDIRLFCLGKELKDDLFMYSYDIVDEVVMQVMIKK